MSEPIEIKLDNKEVESRLLDLAKRSENLRPLMKNIAGIFAYSTEENFKEEGMGVFEAGASIAINAGPKLIGILVLGKNRKNNK